MPQSRYWQEMYDLKSHSFYIEKYHQATEQMDRTINSCLAVASSSSIGAWALWKDYAYIWAFIIAASQVVTTLKPFLPYRASKRFISRFRRTL
jgi:hypothetical protein